MSFKNLRLYTVDLSNNSELKNIFANETLLEECIASCKFRKTMEQEMSTCGFAPLFGRHTDAFTFSSNHNHFFRFVEENKLLPSTIIKEAFLDEVDRKENELNRALKKDEKQALKLALTNKMMAQAFVTRRELFVWVNSLYGFVGVSATSAKRAESAITVLRKALHGSFPAKPLQPRCVVEDRLTSFIAKGDLPQDFKLGYDCVLKSTDDTGATVRASKEDLTCKEINSHIEAGKRVTEVQLDFVENAQFVITSELAIKRITLDDQYLERSLPQKTDDKIADMQSYMLVDSDVLTAIFDKVMKAFDCVTN